MGALFEGSVKLLQGGIPTALRRTSDEIKQTPTPRVTAPTVKTVSLRRDRTGAIGITSLIPDTFIKFSSAFDRSCPIRSSIPTLAIALK
jgi:hypothetical protein